MKYEAEDQSRVEVVFMMSVFFVHLFHEGLTAASMYLWPLFNDVTL